MIKNFVDSKFNHFNSLTLKKASESYVEQIQKGNKMMITMAGAMSTALIGKMGLVDMINKGAVHAITCTGANLEEDIFRLIADTQYKIIPEWRTHRAEEDLELGKTHARVTDIAIPEEYAIRKLEKLMLAEWKDALKANSPKFPYEFIFNLFRKEKIQPLIERSLDDSWVYACFKKNIPIFVPGWEDSTLGNIFTSYCTEVNSRPDKLQSFVVKSGIEVMMDLIRWYTETTKKTKVGFYQIGGGIAGDFPICVVPLLRADLELDVHHWSYFCQICDSTESYGSYSGARPNEKISWDKLNPESPSFVIESDATIVLPLMFSYIIESL